VPDLSSPTPVAAATANARRGHARIVPKYHFGLFGAAQHRIESLFKSAAFSYSTAPTHAALLNFGRIRAGNRPGRSQAKGSVSGLQQAGARSASRTGNRPDPLSEGGSATADFGPVG